MARSRRQQPGCRIRTHQSPLLVDLPRDDRHHRDFTSMDRRVAKQSVMCALDPMRPVWDRSRQACERVWRQTPKPLTDRVMVSRRRACLHMRTDLLQRPRKLQAQQRRSVESAIVTDGTRRILLIKAARQRLGHYWRRGAGNETERPYETTAISARSRKKTASTSRCGTQRYLHRPRPCCRFLQR